MSDVLRWGVLGAAMGAVPVFIFTGLLAILGVAAASGGGPELLQVAFGPVLGPHVSFGGGVAAAAYAGSSSWVACLAALATFCTGR